MKTFLIIYLSCAAFNAIACFLLEWLYYYEKQLEYIPSREIWEDVFITIASALGTLCILFAIIFEACLGFPSKGHGLYMNKRPNAKVVNINKKTED